MGQPFSRRGDSRATHGKTFSGLGSVGWKQLVAEGVPPTGSPEVSPSPSGEMASTNHSLRSPVSSVSMLANYDDDERMDPLTEESSSWETVQLDDDNDSDGEDKSKKTKHFRYSSIKSQRDKKAAKKRKRASNNRTNASSPPTPTASSTSDEQRQTTPHGNILAGKFGAKQNGNCFRAGTLPAFLSDSKPMKDADRLLGVLTEHACVDSYLDEEQEAGDSVRRLIENDIVRERSVNTLLRELNDIDGRKSDRHLSVTAFPAMSLNVIPEIVGEEPVDPDEFKYSDMNLYF